MRLLSLSSLFLLFSLVTLSLPACGPNNTPTDGGAEKECLGEKGCSCYPNKTCNEGLVCQQGICQQDSTPDSGPSEGERAGEEIAEVSPEVDALCEPGTASCRCLPTQKCFSGLRCEDGLCQTCTPGTAGCACKADDSCDGGLTCQDGSCLGCVGKANCPCYSNNTCDKGHRCVTSSGGIGLCQLCKGDDKSNCTCKTDADCGKLACINRRCRDLKSLQKIPANPRCYAPCEGDVKKKDGTLRICHPTFRLLSGCNTGQVCDQGSCIVQSQQGKLSVSKYPFCQDSADCPLWQTCIEGRCYSSCSSQSDCPSSLKCFRYVCRRPCNVTKNECARNETCESKGTNDGVCVPKSTRYKTKPPQNKTLGTFKLPAKRLSFSNHKTSQELYIINKSGFPTSFTLSRQSDSISSKNPLFWLKFDLCKTYEEDGRACKQFEGNPSAQEPFRIPSIGVDQMMILRVSNAGGKPKDKAAYKGTLSVSGEQIGTQEVAIDYRETGDGQWKGVMISFGNFNDKNIEKFPAAPSLNIRDVPNALLRRWINLKRQNISFPQFRAVLRSVREGSWNLPKVRQDCKTKFSTQASEDVVCYPYTSSKGYEILSYSNREAPVPTGISELSFAMNVQEKPGNLLVGRIVTGLTLQYPGNPEIRLAFDGKPGSKAVSLLKSLEATIQIGGRHYTDDRKSCADPKSFAAVTIPWLIPGFEAQSYPSTGLFRQRFECRSKTTPKIPAASANEEEKKAVQAYNLSLSAANPIPDGWVLNRKLELVDGALVDNRYLFVLYRERFTSFFAEQGNHNSISKDIVHYGYILLQRTDADLEPDDFQGYRPPALQSCSASVSCPSGKTCVGGACKIKSQLAQVACDPDTVKKALNKNISSQKDLQNWTGSQLVDLTVTLIDGQKQIASSNGLIQADSNGEYKYIDPPSQKRMYVHYLCEDAGIFNGGPLAEGEPCPVGSKVVFFATDLSNHDIRHENCQQNKSCNKRYRYLKNRKHFRESVPFRCKDKNEVFCEKNRQDLREGKVFFPPSVSNRYVSPYNDLRVELAQAFRYRIKFTSRSGKNIGFTPEICQGNSSQTPYCYNPKGIEEIERRVNCLEALYADKNLYQRLDANTKLKLKKFLELAFSYKNSRGPGGTIQTEFGFEMLNAELKIMLGDEAYTRAFSSRYDLAGSSMISFEGDKFEPNGLNLSGALGYEMHNLYLSAQYYQLVLDRIFNQTAAIYKSFQSSSNSFITIESVTSYFQKILLASTRKARSWSQIAKRYHSLDRADLAQHVIERAYTATYIEKTILTRLLRAMAQVTDNKQLPQISNEIDRVNLTYKAAFLDMEEVYKKLSQETNFLGFPAGYIPFPALDHFSATTASTNAFTVSLHFAKEKLAIARNKEQIALQSKRSFDTDAASFQSELVRIEQNYENQLVAICGGLQDGNRIVPATPKYAYLAPKALQEGNPCGLISGGQLYDARANLEKTRIHFESMRIAQQNVVRQIKLEEKRIQRFCNAKFELAKVTWEVRKEQANLQKEIRDAQYRSEQAMRIFQDIATIADMAKCNIGLTTNCPSALLGAGIVGAAAIAREIVLEKLKNKLGAKRREIAELDRKLEKSQIKAECDICNPENQSKCKEGVARIESQIKLTQLRNQMLNFHLEALKAEYDIRIALSQIVRLEQRAKRLMTQQKEAEQMAINVQAAKNDPNVRIYKNDAILTAERTFEEAMKEAYRATLIYEYYTGSTYKRKGDLYLIRMISYGDKNLEAYLSQLEQAFRGFEEENGKPDHRVLVLSLRDDILRIPRSDEQGNPRTLNDRVNELQQQLSSRSRLNSEGFTAFPFSLSVVKGHSPVSPITVNHKILYMEAEIVGGDIGDGVGRLYLRQKGTGVVRLPDDDLKFHALPIRTAVLNPFFNGAKIFAPDIYKNYRLRDRPLGNTHWELLLNQVSEQANQDINLNSVNDIKLYLYYTDFTEE